jgi:hypothetical protein
METGNGVVARRFARKEELVQAGKRVACRHRVEAGEIVVADGSAILEMVLAGCVGLVLYDRAHAVAAATLVSAEPEGLGGRDLRERVNVCALSLLAELSRKGGSLDALEVFALGSLFDSGAAASLPGPLAASKVSLAYAPPNAGARRRMEFKIESGRMVLEHTGVASGEGGPDVC